jgi:hypothetical protein
MPPEFPDSSKDVKIPHEKKKAVLSNNAAEKLPATPAIRKNLVPQFEKAKLVSDAKKLSDAVLGLSQKPKGDLPSHSKPK